MRRWTLRSLRFATGLAGTGLICGCAAPKLADRKSPPKPPVAQSPVEHAGLIAGRSAQAPESNDTRLPKSGRLLLTSHEADSELLPPAANSEATSLLAQPPSTSNAGGEKHPIDLETALQLTSGQNPQVAFARER